jgi:deoxyribodipyrimidine photo-lyase
MNNQSQQPIILWFRQDLRLADNPSLDWAVKSLRPIIPIYVLDANISIGEASKWWLHNSLEELNKSLDDKLNFFIGNPEEIIAQIIREINVSEIVWNRCYEPDTIKRDAEIKVSLKSKNILVKSFNSTLLLEPLETVKEDKTNYKIFTPFYKKNYASGNPKIRLPLAKPSNLNLLKIKSVALAELSLIPKINWYKNFKKLWQPGEYGANIAFNEFLQTGLKNYKELRNRPDLEHSSRLSPHLHFGEISPNAIWLRVRSYLEKNNYDIDAEHFLSELVWREFSYSLLYFFPDLPTKNLQSSFDNFPWQNNNDLLKKWQKGKTGYPIVDAGMRELWQTGFMHNRVRMIVASFLVKHLLIDRRYRAEWFNDCLVDADLANNSASWQWVAGSGADAAPYFRIFNPILQGQKFDPEGAYTKKFVPELKNLPVKYLFAPWLASENILSRHNIKLGIDYPEPIVDHTQARQRALEAYAEIKK